MAILPQEVFRFCGPTYQSVSPVADSERAFNLYPEANPASAKTPVTLVGTPGLELFATLPHGPVRALGAGNGRLFAVGGQHFYEVNPTSGAIITDYGNIGAAVGIGPAKIVFGMVSGSAQLLVFDPSVTNLGETPGAVFYPDIAGPSMVLVTKGGDLEYLGNYYFTLLTNVQNGVASSAAGDGSTWPSLNAIIRNTTVDQVNGLIAVQNNLWIFGQKTITPYYNAGTSGFPFALVNQATIQLGALGSPVESSSGSGTAFHIIKANNTVYWIGADDRGFARIWMARGYQPIPVSTPGVDQVIASYGDISGARGFAYEEGGHLFCVWNFPNANSGNGATLVFDVTTNLFHERMYWDGATQTRWRADCFASVELGGGATNFVGDYANGKIYKLSLSYTSDAGTAIRRIRTAPIIAADNEWLTHGSFELDADIGTAIPFLTMSNNGARSFLSNSYQIPQMWTDAGSGITKYVQDQLGSAVQRVYRVTITDADNPIRLLGSLADVYK